MAADLPSPDDLKDPLTRWLTIGIVLTTLAGAVVGYLLVSASQRGENAQADAQRLGVRSVAAFLDSQQRALAQYETFMASEVDRRKASNALQENVFSPNAKELGLELQLEQFQDLADVKENVPKRVDPPLVPLTAAGSNGPDQDPTFPQRFFAQSEGEGVRLQALQDAANEESSAWDGRVATYTAVVTLLAVAVYLFGLALTVQIAQKQLFAVVGAVLVGIGVLWALVTAVRVPHRAPPLAATEFARGTVAFDSASDRAGYEQARRHFSRAIELRPSFARAYESRADVVFSESSPQTGGYRSLTTSAALKTSIEDELTARSLGLDSYNLLTDLGFNQLSLGLKTNDDGPIKDSIATTQEAIDTNPNEPVSRLNLGAALLSLGRFEDARAAYVEAIERLLYSDVEKKTLRPSDSYFVNNLANSALTDLEQVLRARPRLGRDVQAIKELIVRSVALDRVDPPPVRRPVTLRNMRVDVYPSDVQVADLEFRGFDPNRDKLSIEWYFDSGGLGWGVISEVSGVRTAGYLGSVAGDATNGYYDDQSYLYYTTPVTCLGEGKYKVEVYVNGELIKTSQKEVDFGRPGAAWLRDMGVAACRPAEWVRAPSANTFPGLVDGYVSEDGSHGLYFFRLNVESKGSASDLDGWLDALMNNFGNGLLPGPYDPYFLRQDQSYFSAYFMGLDGARVRRYGFAGGEAVAAGAPADDGGLVFAVMFGSRGYPDTAEGLNIWESLSTRAF
ncbi:MAG TPA: tetratricopeptide repeat protein [Actinomycetota bacterium]|jgi:tetratricopeptide (TPR) repeat protein